MHKLIKWSNDRNFGTTLGGGVIKNSNRILIENGGMKISIIQFSHIDPLLGEIGKFEIFTFDKLFKDTKRFDTSDEVINFLNELIDGKKCETCNSVMEEHDYPEQYDECVKCTWDDETATMQKELRELLKLKEETDNSIEHLKNQLEYRE